MAQRRSLSGRSAFCQLKVSEKSQIHWKRFSTKATDLKHTMKQNHQPRCSLPESAGEGGWSLFLGRLDQGLVGNAESTHVNRPRGATLVPQVGRCCKFWKELNSDYLRQVCSAGWTSILWRFSGMQLVCASYVPKLKLPCPRASLVFSWRQVVALPRLGLWRVDPSASLCTGRCTYGLGAQGHPGLLHPRWRLARRQPNGAPRREDSSTRSKPRQWVKTDGTPTGTSMCHHLSGERVRKWFWRSLFRWTGECLCWWRKTELIFRFRKSFFIFQSFWSGLIITECSRTVWSWVYGGVWISG